MHKHISSISSEIPEKKKHSCRSFEMKNREKNSTNKVQKNPNLIDRQFHFHRKIKIKQKERDAPLSPNPKPKPNNNQDVKASKEKRIMWYPFCLHRSECHVFVVNELLQNRVNFSITLQRRKKLTANWSQFTRLAAISYTYLQLQPTYEITKLLYARDEHSI